MPPLPSVPNVLRYVFKGVSSATSPFNWVNILHGIYSGAAPSETELNAYATAVRGAWANLISSLQISSTSLESLIITDLASNSGAVGEWLGLTPGTRGDDEIPANAAVLVSYPVGVRYRGGHPRTYLLCGGNADFQDSSHWSSGFQTEVQSKWTQFLGQMITTAPSPLVITSLCAVSYIDKNLNPVPPYRRTNPVVYPINYNQNVVQQQMASQRRRIGRRRK